MTDEELGPDGPVGHTPHDSNPQMTVSVAFEAATPQGTGAAELAHVSIQDSKHPGIRASLTYYVPEDLGRIETVGFSVTRLVADRPEGAAPFGPGVVKDLPLARWDRVAQAAVRQAALERSVARVSVPLETTESRRTEDGLSNGPDDSSEVIATPLHVSQNRRERAIEMVRRVRPDLDPAESKGSARSWNGLVKLAVALDEYTELLAKGSTDVVGEMAAAHGVAPATVRTWIHRARQAGITATGWLGDAPERLVPSYYRAAAEGRAAPNVEGSSGPDPADVARFDRKSSPPSQPSRSLISRPNLTQRQAAFKALGRRFLMARERSGIRLVEARKKIGIDSSVINKIDRGDFHVIGGDAELRGFILVYAAALGLDPEDVLSEYRAAKKLPDVLG